MLNYPTSQLLVATETNIDEKVKYTANTGIVAISTANSSLTGGTIGSVLTAGENGTLITSVTIKATGNTTRGMIRFFIADSETFTRIIDEVDVPARIQSATQDTFCITLETNWCLKSSWVLGASTEKGEGFVITAEGLDYSYPTSLNGL
jgi:hypothetical protein